MSSTSLLAQEQSMKVYAVDKESNQRIEIGSFAASDTTTIRKSVIKAYYSAGYLSVKLTELSRDSLNNDTVLYAYVEKGEVFTIKEIIIRINGDSLPEWNSLNNLVGDRLNFNVLEDRLSALQLIYENRGYAFAKTGIDSLQIFSHSSQINLHLFIESGDLQTIGGMQFLTTASYSSTYLRRLTRIRMGSVITPRLLEDGRTQLIRSQLFNVVSEPELALKDSLTFLFFELEPRNPNVFDLIIGYVPEPQGGGTIVGTGRLHVRNIVTEGSRLRLSFERLQQLVTKFNMEASQAWVKGLPIEVGGGFHFIQQDTSYQLRNLRLRSTYWLGNTLSVGVSYRREDAAANENLPGIQRVLDANTQFIGVSFSLDNLDAKDIPTRGWLINVEAETGRRVNRPSAFLEEDERRYNQQLIRGDISWHYSPVIRQIIVSRIFGYAMIAPRYLENDLSRFGGAQTLRGYREDQFFASKMLWGDLEYRYLLDRDTYGFLFTAHGYYNRPQLVTELDKANATVDYLRSYGFGLAYRTKLGMLRFTYAKSPEDPFSNAKIHFGIQGDLN